MEIHPLTRSSETDEVLRRIGRNVVNLQYVERLFKRLMEFSVPMGPVSKMKERYDAHVSRVNSRTMGELAGKLLDTVLTPSPEERTPTEANEVWMGFQFTMEVSAEFRDQHAKEMQALVDTRNDLIHHFLPRWHAAVGGDTAEALAYLDAQHAMAMEMMDRLKGWVRSTEETLKAHKEFLQSAEGRRHIELAPLRCSHLVALLGEVATRTARADGWAYLTTAAHLIHREAPGEISDLPKKFGLPNLKAVVQTSEFFDVKDEPLPNGGTRTVYRISDRYTFTPSSVP